MNLYTESVDHLEKVLTKLGVRDLNTLCALDILRSNETYEGQNKDFVAIKVHQGRWDVQE